MHTIFFFISIVVLSFIYAKVEINIEGPHGWAEKLPTWRSDKNSFLSKVFYGGRPATGYHFWAAAFIVLIFHFVYLFHAFSPKIELQLISGLMFFGILEDFFWFVFNPAFGIKKFKKENIWWHEKNWWFFAPREYFIFLPLGLILYYISQVL